MKAIMNYGLTLLLVFVVQLGFAQEKTITGTVVDQKDAPVPGVTVQVQGTDKGVSTDFDGNYSLEAAQGDVLEFSFIGFKTVTKTIGESDTVNVQMEEGTALDEVLLVGYGQTTKQAFTGTAATIDGDKLVEKNVSNATQALDGEISGVNVITNSGQPGEAPTIRIRGFGSVNGNRDPLIVLDGVPFDGNVSAINPNDIENMTVLKDATATAIYGSRGANGVILIKTKRGEPGKSTINVSYKIGQNFRALPRYQTIKSPETYTELSWEGWKNRGQLSGGDGVDFANNYLFSANGMDPHYNIWDVDNTADLINPSTGKIRDGVNRLYNPLDWADYAFNPSVRSEGNVNFSGGEGKTTYYASFGYLDDKGYSINSDFNRYTMRLNLQQDITDWLDGSLNMGYSISKSNQNGQASDSGSIFWFADNIPPVYPLFKRDGDGNKVEDPIYGGYQYDYGDAAGAGRGFGLGTNAIADATYNLDETKKHEINVSNTFTATITDGLTAETRLGVQYLHSLNDNLGNPFYGSAASQNGSIYKVQTTEFSYNFLQLLRYKKSFNQHHFEVFAAHEINSHEYKYMNGSKSNIVVPWIPELNNGVVSTPSSSYTQDNTLESFFGQINYDYDNKYFVTGSLRRDGSSRFADGNRWDTFGSLGLSWVISREDFLSDVDWIDNLKVKTSYGLTGEESGVGYYPYTDLYELNNLNNELALSFNTKGNPDLTWETSKMFQAGVEFGFGKVIEGSVDYYIKNTDNLLFDRRVPPSLGYGIISVNDGKLRNAGLEFDLTGHVLKGDDFFVDVNLNGAHLNNELKEMPIDPATDEPKVLDVDGNYGRAKGHSLYDFYIREWAGVDKEEGFGQWNVYYDDANGNGELDDGEAISSLAGYKAKNPDADIQQETTDSYQDATRKYVGKSTIPDLHGGFGINAGYKNFSLSVQFKYAIGGYGYDFIYSRLMDNTVPGNNNWHKDILNRWQEPGDQTDVPRLSADYDQDVAGSSTRFLVKKDFLNLNNIRLGYTLPTSWIKNLGMSTFQVYVSGDNLALWNKRKGYNPMTSQSGQSDWYTYNPLSSWTAGVNITF